MVNCWGKNEGQNIPYGFWSSEDTAISGIARVGWVASCTHRTPIRNKKLYTQFAMHPWLRGVCVYIIYIPLLEVSAFVSRPVCRPSLYFCSKCRLRSIKEHKFEQKKSGRRWNKDFGTDRSINRKQRGRKENLQVTLQMVQRQSLHAH